MHRLTAFFRTVHDTFPMSKHLFVVLPLLAVLLIVSCGGSHETARGRLPFGVMDIPHGGDTLSGVATLSGWALAEGGIKEVNVYVDRNYAATSMVGASRPDVANAFPAIPNGAACGWTTSLNTKIYTPGSHEIVIEAVGKNGAIRDIATVSVNVAH